MSTSGGGAGPRCDLLVIGGGPAGLAAAAVAASLGLRTVLVDERPTLGGQIYRQPGPGFVVHDRRKVGADFLRGQALVESARRAGARLYTATSVASLRGTSAVLFSGGTRPEVAPQLAAPRPEVAPQLAAPRPALASGPAAAPRPAVGPGSAVARSSTMTRIWRARRPRRRQHCAQAVSWLPPALTTGPSCSPAGRYRAS